MNISILGTGIVGRSHARRLVELGHEVYLGTRDTQRLLAQSETDGMGNEPILQWLKNNSRVSLMSFPEALEKSDVIFNALKGEAVISTLREYKDLCNEKIIVDISNPLDFSRGMPPILSVCNMDSLGEQIQCILAHARVVKAFNTVSASVQVNPASVAEGAHDLFLCGNDEAAKIVVSDIAQSYGWKYIRDLGDISASRGMEMFLPLWLRLWGSLGTANFNIHVRHNISQQPE